MNYKISQRAASLSPSLTLVVDSKAKQMKAEGVDVVGFGAGEPAVRHPAARQGRLRRGARRRLYQIHPGRHAFHELRQAIADKFKRENGL